MGVLTNLCGSWKYVYEIITLYAFNLYDVVGQIYLSKAGENQLIK